MDVSEPIKFEPYDGVYLFCVGDNRTFDEVFHAYCFIDRICFQEQVGDPAYEPFRAKLAAAIQRGINAGFVQVADDGRLSPSTELTSRFQNARAVTSNEFDAAEVVEEFLRSREWPLVSNAVLR